MVRRDFGPLGMLRCNLGPLGLWCRHPLGVQDGTRVFWEDGRVICMSGCLHGSDRLCCDEVFGMAVVGSYGSISYCHHGWLGLCCVVSLWTRKIGLGM